MIPIIVLNLERSINRKQSMINQFNNLRMDEGLHYYFLPAFDGVNITNFSFNVNIAMGYGTGRKFQKAEVGIIVSQIAAIKFAQTMNFDKVIILEDDVVLCEDWHERLDRLLNLLPETWEHVYLSGHSDYVKLDKYANFGTPSIVEAPKMVGAFSYMVNKPAYSKLTRFTSSILTTFDDMVMYMIDQKKLNSYVYFPFMTFHNADDSTVWDGKDPGHLSHEGNMHSSYKYFKNKL